MGKSAKRKNLKNRSPGHLARTVEESRGSGVMSSLRGGFQSVAGVGKKQTRHKTRLQKTWDVLFWILIIAGLIWFLYRRLG
jgi:hypothetical protein